MNTCRLYLIRHAPVKKKDGYVPENNPKAIINSDHLKKLAAYIPDNSLCYVSPLKRLFKQLKNCPNIEILRK